MAPIPEDNRQRLPKEDDSEIDMFSNPNLSVTQEMSDTSDDNEGDINNDVDTSVYTLLSQDPDEGSSSDEDDDDDDDDLNNERIRTGHIGLETNMGPSTTNESHDVGNEIGVTDTLSHTVVQSEADSASAPSISVSSSSCHPLFLAKFPEGKVPSYMQVPPIHSDSKELLWNQRRQDKSAIYIDSGQESKILKAMAGFSLPRDHVPEWARNLSDDQWKQHVLGRLSPEEMSAKLPEEKNRASNDQTNQQMTKLNTVDPGNDWVATFPDP